ncbi:hypothetical protein CYMTET_56924 [Cymbomonas tetramitiformis]|uniref:C2 domain-containing protein n=1 Tax=Cymbomonas tetramitiformis TaxID=36881 RepID=A0AAE0BB52_9CHLO|nr:hypothetical protein CYMTET_56924 [Cymbomonas tetramitiformis]
MDNLVKATDIIRGKVSTQYDTHQKSIGFLSITLHSASGLYAHSTDRDGKADPYVKFDLYYRDSADEHTGPGSRFSKIRGARQDVEDTVLRSSVVHGTLHPEWNEVYFLTIYGESAVLSCEVFDLDHMRNDKPMGRCEVPLQRLLPRQLKLGEEQPAGRLSHEHFALRSDHTTASANGETCGELCLSVDYIPSKDAYIAVNVRAAKELGNANSVFGTISVGSIDQKLAAVDCVDGEASWWRPPLIPAGPEITPPHVCPMSLSWLTCNSD